MQNRRTFLKTAIVSAPLILSAKTLGQEGAAPSDRVRIGLIGLGGRCRWLTEPAVSVPEIEVAAVCDCFQPRVDEFLGTLGKDRNWTGYTDFREMIEKENLDGVMVETTTHARAWVACNAMAMGVDAYIEKPMSLTIAEGREMVNCARKHERVTQVGTQQRSIPLNNWASDLVKNGAIGKVLHVLAPNFVGPGHWNRKAAQPLPEGSNPGWWEVWTNQAEWRPYHNDLHHGWARWADYDGGGVSYGVTGWGAHSYDQIQRGLGTDETGPVEVVLEEAVETKRVGAFDREPGENETGSGYYQMITNTSGPRAKVRMKYASGTELHLYLDGDNSPGLGCRYVGENGWIEVNRDRLSADPGELIVSPDRPEPLQVEESVPHLQNWVDCIKSRERCHADIEYGQRSSTICYLVNIARDLGQVGAVLQWDPAAEQFTNSDEANAMLSQTRREGFALPA